MEQLRGIGPLLWQRTVSPECISNHSGRLRRSHRATGKGLKKARDAIDQLGAQDSKLLGTHLERRLTILQAVVVAHTHHQQNSTGTRSQVLLLGIL